VLSLPVKDQTEKAMGKLFVTGLGQRMREDPDVPATPDCLKGWPVLRPFICTVLDFWKTEPAGKIVTFGDSFQDSCVAFSYASLYLGQTIWCSLALSWSNVDGLLPRNQNVQPEKSGSTKVGQM